jgi:amino acid transporter
MEPGLNRSKTNQNNGIIVMIIGIVLFFIGVIAFSITETSRVGVLGIEVELTTRPYAAIGALLMISGIVGIIVGIVIKISSNDKSTIFPPQQPQQQYYQQPYQQYYQQPPQQYYQQPPQQYYQNPNPQPQQVRYCPNCKQPTGNQTGFCPSCGVKI